jgi:hypothetical protein
MISLFHLLIWLWQLVNLVIADDLYSVTADLKDCGRSVVLRSLVFDGTTTELQVSGLVLETIVDKTLPISDDGFLTAELRVYAPSTEIADA